MTPSAKCLELIKSFEGLFLKAYLDPIGIPTIGWGTIRYQDGRKVKIGDVITLQQAESELMYEVVKVGTVLQGLNLNQNQFDALCSWIYNLGSGNWNKSTLKKKVIANPNDQNIATEIQKWNRAGGKVLKGLVSRRKKESELYFTLT